MLLQLCPDMGTVQLFTLLLCGRQSLTLPAQGFRRKDDLRTSLGANSGGLQKQAPGLVPARHRMRSHSKLIGGGRASEDSYIQDVASLLTAELKPAEQLWLTRTVPGCQQLCACPHAGTEAVTLNRCVHLHQLSVPENAQSAHQGSCSGPTYGDGATAWTHLHRLRVPENAQSAHQGIC